jgi:type IV pilus assembly protein PilY1
MNVFVKRTSNTGLTKLLMLTSVASLFASLHLSVNAQTSLAVDLRQQPITFNITAAPNIILMMDDSSSMNGTSLAPPPGISWGLLSFSDFLMFPNNSGSTTLLSRDEVLYYNPQYNPLAYNPAITYKPWNDNNKVGAANFPPAKIGTLVAGVVTDKTRNDMRFRIESGVKIEFNPTSEVTRDLFTRDGTRDVGVCTLIEPVTSTYCSSSTPGTTTPNPDSEEGVSVGSSTCTGYTTSTNNVCTARSTVLTPELIDARYTRFEGADATELTDRTKYRLVEIDRSAPARMYPTPIDPYTGLQIERFDCLNPLSCTFTEEAQNYANYHTYYRTRLFAAIAVTSQVLPEIDDKIRIGYGRLNYFADGPTPWPLVPSTKPPAVLPVLDGQANPGHIVRGVRPFTLGSSDRQEVFTWLFGLSGVGGTPIREAMDAAGKYYQRSDNQGPWSNIPGTGDPTSSTQLACRKNFTLIATDGAWTDSPNHPRIQTLYPGLPDGSPAQTDSIAGPTILGAGKQTGRNYQYTPTAEPFFGTSGSGQQTLTDVAMYYWGTDLRPDLANVNRPTPWSAGSGYGYPRDFSNPSTWQSMSNFILGYGLQPSVSPIAAKAAMASNSAFTWPTVNVANTNDNNKVDDALRAALVSRGDFFTAQNPTQLASALKKVFARLGSTRGASSTIALSNQVITSSTDLIFESSYESGDWNGSLRAISALDAIAGTTTSVWSANFPSNYTTRKLLTTTGQNTPIDFRWTQLTPIQKTKLTSEAVFDYLIGDRSGEAPVGTLRERGSLLGSIVSSSPLYSGATHHGYQSLTAGGSTYPSYLETKRSSRKKSVFVGSNSGMLHSFDALTGTELFAFTPRAAIPKMADLANPSYVHRFLVDGQLSEGDFYSAGSWKTALIGSGGAGPKSIFALDITNPDAMTTSQVLWEVTEQNEPELGHIIGSALVAPTRANKWVVITGNGFESRSGKASLLVFDLLNGNTIRNISTGVGATTSAATQNGLGPVTPIYDSQRNVIGVYGGDKKGNLWRFDLSDPDPANWRITTSRGALTAPVFTATDSTGVPQPITTAPRIGLHPLGGLYVVFGTGKGVENSDILDRQVQSIYAIRDKDNSGPYSKTDLKLATLTDVAGDLRQISGLKGPGGVDWSIHKGWYFNLTTNALGGERVMSSPRLSAGILSVASFNPENLDPCDSGGKSFVYAFDLATDFSRPAFAGQDPTIVGSKANDGIVSQLASLYSPALRPATKKNSIDLATLKRLAKDTRYAITTGVLTDRSTPSFCALAANSVNNSNVTVPTACAGTTPLRAWRDLK